MSKTQVNGETPSSKTVSHIANYPLSSDIINMYQSNQMGAASINLVNAFYTRFHQSFFPYLQTPYSIIAPYLEKADHLGDSALSNVDERFPAIKQTDMDTLKGHASNAAIYPLRLADETREYLFKTYADEYNKNGANGLVSHGKAMITTELRVVADALAVFAQWAGPKKDEAKAEYEKMKKLGNEKYQKSKNAANDAKGDAEAKVDEVTNGQ